MAPLKPVRSLFESCLEKVLLIIKTGQKNNSKLKNRKKKGGLSLSETRNVFINMLHGAIRNQLINISLENRHYSIEEVLYIIQVLGDSSIKKLNLRQDRIFFEHPGEFFSILDSSDITGLHELTLKVNCPKDGKGRGDELEGVHMASLYSALERGLASHLRVLALENCADNQILHVLGKSALNLTSLDLSNSWHVDDTGITHLLFKDVQDEDMSQLPWQDFENGEPRAVNAFSFINDSKLNLVCKTLTELRIQDTNTSSISVLLILMFVKNLKSLGGFLYYRNIGDAILSVCETEGGPKSLAMSDLWDTQLPDDKLSRLSACIPRLSSLYTRVFCLPDKQSPLPQLTNLTADFDFNCQSNLYYFLPHGGLSLRRLVLLDQIVPIALEYLACYCPLLEYLVAKVDLSNASSLCPLSHLKEAKLRITSPQTFLWLMRQADSITELDLQVERHFPASSGEMFETEVIDQLLADNCKSLKSIEVLNIRLWFAYQDGYILSCGTLKIDSAYALCSVCDSLRILGELDTWYSVSERDVNKMANHIRKSNWNVQLCYKQCLYPAT